MGTARQPNLTALQSQQLSQLSRLASLSHGMPADQGDSVRAELRAVQDRLLGQQKLQGHDKQVGLSHSWLALFAAGSSA